jgi:thiosulfate/3-mercaptopyruvate sulfurtransferase
VPKSLPERSLPLRDFPKPASAAAIFRVQSITWSKACNDDGSFKSYDELKTLYEGEGITGENPVIAYCRIGERSSHTWFVLKYLLGYKDVRNCDGSWTEWGNLVRAPVEKP